MFKVVLYFLLTMTDGSTVLQSAETGLLADDRSTCHARIAKINNNGASPFVAICEPQ